MPADYAPVEPHGSLTPFLDDVWSVSGSVVMGPLVRITRTMTVVRHDGDLTLINAVRLGDEGLAALTALGTIRNVVKIGVHGMDDAFYVGEHGATPWALAGAEYAPGGTPAQPLTPDSLPIPGAQFFAFELTNKPESALLLPHGGGVLVTCDAVQNWEHTDGCSVVGKVVTHVFGFIKPAQIGPPWKKIMTPEGGSLRPDFERLAALPFQHLIGGHGEPLRDVARDRLQATIAREL